MNTYFWTAVGAATASASLVGHAIGSLLAASPGRVHVQRAPVPRWLRPVWPAARRWGPAAQARLPATYAEHVGRRLRAAELEIAVTPGEWSAARLSYGAVAAAALAAIAVPTGVPALVATVSGAILGIVLPELRLRESIARRQDSIRKELPVYLDVLTLAVESGSSLTAAIRLATEKAPDGPLRRAFLRLLADVRAGRPRADALQALEQSAALPAITSLVAALLQSEKTGARLGPVLRAQSTQRTQERFARAEKLAMQAPVKLLGPLILCIFPCTFVVLGFPIVVKLMAGY